MSTMSRLITSVAVLKDRISATLEQDDFTDFESFARAARANGVDAEERGKGVSYAMLRLGFDGADYMPIATSDKRRASKLGRDFEKTAIEAAIERNIEAEKQRAKAPKVPERELPVDPVASRLDAIMADAPAHEAALDDVMLWEPKSPAAQGAQVEDEDLEVAPRRRRRATTDEDRDRDETAPTVTGPVQSPQTAQEPLEHKKIDGFYGIDKTGLELIARQRAKQPSMVDFQLRAGTHAAYGQHGLSLHQATSPSGKKHGFIQISRQKVAELEQAAGDNYVDIKGDRVSGVVADVTYNEKRGPWLPSRFGKSKLEPVMQDTMRQQAEAQREAREQGLLSRSRRAKLDMQAREQTIEISRYHDRGYGLGD